MGKLLGPMQSRVDKPSLTLAKYVLTGFPKEVSLSWRLTNTAVQCILSTTTKAFLNACVNCTNKVAPEDKLHVGIPI